MNNYKSWCPSIKTYEIINIVDVFNCYLMVFITLKLIFFLKLSQFFFTSLLFVFVLLLPSLIMEWSHIFSSEVQVNLFIFWFILRYFDLVNNFFFQKSQHKFWM